MIGQPQQFVLLGRGAPGDQRNQPRNVKGRDAALAVLDEVVTSDYSMRDPSGDLSGREALRQFLAMLFDGMPDLRMSLDDMVAADDRVAYQFTIRGKHTGELMGFPPTKDHT